MKKQLLFLIPVFLLYFSCKKDSVKTFNTSSLNIVNASINEPNVLVNLSSGPIIYSIDQSNISFGSYLEFGNPAGNLPVTLVAATDTIHPIYQNTLNLPTGSIHSLYLIGQAPNISTLLLQDQIPAYKDSTSGVRFINLLPDSQPVTINLQGNPASQTEFTSLAYKQISSFKGYSCKSAYSGSYTFEVRDAATSNLLATFTWNFKPFFCNTLVIDGLENDNTGNYPVSVFQVNHY